MSNDHAVRLFEEASTAGLRITGLDGWTQTRLAGSLRLRREVVNAIINKDPGAQPSESRPRMVEACRKIIAFAAVVSRKDDAVVPCEVDAGQRLDDDAQAYESHKLRLRRLIECAVGAGAFIEAMYGVGELASHAVHAPPRFRVRMIGNVVTAIQRLLDKPQSRSIPTDLLQHNLRRLTVAEWSARRAVRGIPNGAERTKAEDDFTYIRGQVGYAMIFSGLLARSDKAVQRGRRRLWRAARAQPAPDYGHWSNLLRGINDLLANGHAPALTWARAVVKLAEKQRQPGFALAFTRLRDNAEISTLVDFWEAGGLMQRVADLLSRAAEPAPQRQPPRKQRKGTTAAAILLLIGLLLAPGSVRAGDGKELSTRGGSSQRAAPTMASRTRLNASSAGALPAGTTSGASTYPSRVRPLPAARPGFYPPRTPSRIADGALPVRAGDAGGIGDQRAARPGQLPVRVAARNSRPVAFDRVDPDTDRVADIRPVEDAQPLIDEADAAPPPRVAARSATPAKSRNRLFPLIVVRDLEPKAPTRTVPKSPRPKEDTSKEEVSETPRKSPPIAAAFEPSTRAVSDRRS